MFLKKLASVLVQADDLCNKVVDLVDQAKAHVRFERMDVVCDGKRWVGRNLEVCREWRTVDADDFTVTVFHVFLCKTKAGAFARVTIDHLGDVSVDELSREQFDDQILKCDERPSAQEA
ncbi:hypothetical protein P5704_026615 (plasmid) [Pseudomonas sp. FeN3W]|nr:hypothetical protein P5704_026615 [Pseudomonas sp. FeN3W]